MDVFAFRIVLVVYLVISIGLALLLYRSPGGENTWGQLVPLIGSLALAFVALAPSLKQESKNTFIFPNLFRDTEHGTLLASSWEGPYFQSMATTMGKLGAQGGATGMEVKVAKEEEIAFLEYVIIENLMRTFQGGPWDGTFTEHPQVYGASGYGMSIVGVVDLESIHQQQEILSALGNC